LRLRLSGNKMKRQKRYLIFLIGARGYFSIAFVANNQSLLN
jgi:hypothetical protein